MGGHPRGVGVGSGLLVATRVGVLGGHREGRAEATHAAIFTHCPDPKLALRRSLQCYLRRSWFDGGRGQGEACKVRPLLAERPLRLLQLQFAVADAEVVGLKAIAEEVELATGLQSM